MVIPLTPQVTKDSSRRLFGETYTHEAAINPSGNPAAVRSTAEESYNQRSMCQGYGREASCICFNHGLIQDRTHLGAPHRVETILLQVGEQANTEVATFKLNCITPGAKRYIYNSMQQTPSPPIAVSSSSCPTHLPPSLTLSSHPYTQTSYLLYCLSNPPLTTQSYPNTTTTTTIT